MIQVNAALDDRREYAAPAKLGAAASVRPGP
jgi:hypothetical protein